MWFMTSRIYGDGILFQGVARGARVYADGVLQSESPDVPTATLSTTKSGTFSATLRGTGTVTFDYSEGSPQTLELTLGGVTFSHTYSSADEKEITITGALSEVTYIAINDMDLTNDLSEFSKFRSLDNLYLPSNDLKGDISALTGLPLVFLNLYYNQNITGDISALTGMSLYYLHLINTDVSGDISSLIGMPLTTLRLANINVSGDISALNGMLLDYCILYNTNIGCNGTAITALDGCDIRLQDCGWADDGGDGNETDNYLIVAAAAGHTDCTINIAGNNVARTSASDAALAALIVDGNIVTVNEP
jgi:hypothetical protein